MIICMEFGSNELNFYPSRKELRFLPASSLSLSDLAHEPWLHFIWMELISMVSINIRAEPLHFVAPPCSTRPHAFTLAVVRHHRRCKPHRMSETSLEAKLVGYSIHLYQVPDVQGDDDDDGDDRDFSLRAGSRAQSRCGDLRKEENIPFKTK